MQPGKNDKTRLHFHSYRVERQTTSSFSHNYIAHHICQHIRAKSSYPVKLSYHPDKEIQLFFYAAVTWLPALRTCAS
jgi:hypothetical protein